LLSQALLGCRNAGNLGEYGYMRVKTSGKIVILILVAGLGYGAWKMWGKALMPGADVKESVVPNKITLPEDYSNPGEQPRTVNMPSPNPVGSGSDVRMLVWAWNAQMGLMFANGGPKTTRNSLMADRGVNLELKRQDDSSKMQEALVAFATELSNGNKQPTSGAHFVAIMGDGAGMFLASLNKTLARLGPEYRAKVVTSCGYSHGEDKFMGPPAWKQNPRSSMGGVVAGVLRDGDWNIAQKWLGDNNLRTNPDEKTYDPDALNWVAADDYIDAGTKYITGFSEDRPVVRNGKRTGETKHIVVQGCVTWTPGDVNVAKQKGGIVSIVSTHEYSRQMPNVVIGIDKWMQSNRSTVENFIAAIADGGAAVKSSDAALQKAGQISQDVYKENGADADYWVKYYKGMQEPDKTGMTVDLGGSQANDLADAMFTFGLIQGSANLFAATYTVFADLVHSQYPNLMPDYPSVGQILDTSYLKKVAEENKLSSGAIAHVNPDSHPSGNGGHRSIVAAKNWNIPFETGKASFSPQARGVLEKLRKDLLIAGGTNVEIHGHTDNVGSVDANQRLSEARAFAVQRWLEAQFPMNFPAGRVRIKAEGSTSPLVPNDSETHRAMNRRVEVILTTNQ
jgi:OOP family OmpA-OmpF porin